MSVEPETPLVKASQPFEMFYRSEYGAVLGLTYALSGSRCAAEDLTQEAFLRAHRNWTSIVDYAEPWVRRVAINLARSRLRRLRTEARSMLRLRAEPRHPFPEVSEPTDDFWEEVRRLPRRQAQVTALRYLDDLSVHQISSALEISDAAVKTALFKARKQLSRRLRLDDGGQL